MKRLLIISFMLLQFAAWSQDTTIVQMEYFFDSDPGYDGGTDFTSFSSGTDVTHNESISTSGLNLGFHILYVRALDEHGKWGIPEGRLVYVDGSGVTLLNIDTIEYFIDADPGYGSGTVLADPITAANDVTITDAIPSGSLSLGFHTLFVRAKLEGGVWGIPEQRLVYVDQSGAVANVDYVEYYFDDDPGYGSGTTFGGTITPANNVDVSDSLATSGLSFGFHTLFLRPRLEGGAWGIPESRLIYVDQSGSGANVDYVEYYFDSDPGYGSATAMASFSAGSTVNVMDSLETTDLSIGFHVLYIRPRLEGGTWGIPEQRLIYVDETGSAITNIDRLEYFIDTDPGYGSATAVPISPAGTDIYKKIALAAASVSEGQHFAGVRARDENGRWGIPEIINFYAYSAGRELDSASLVVLFNKTGGLDGTWTNTTNWLSTDVENWHGVTVTNGRVDSVDLSGNELTGVIPRELGYVLDMTYLDLSENNLGDTIPGTLADLTLLEDLRLHDNNFNEIPDLSGLINLATVALDSNQFDFGDLEPFASVSTFTYSNQSLFNDFAEDSIVAVGATMTIDKSTDGSNNVYQWLLNGDTITFADFDIHTINPFLPTDTGDYVLKIQNTLLPALELTSAPYHLRLSDFEEDSLALVSLYNNTEGGSWTTRTNWLAGTLDSWLGVTVNNNRVTDLVLSGNNLTGKIPLDFGYADSLVTIDLSNNLLTDTLPTSWTGFSALVSADISQNDFVKIPDLAPLVGAGSLTALDVSGNRISFGDLERNVSVPTFTYAPMDTLTAARDTLFDADTNPIISYVGTSSNNTYQWLKDGVAVSAPDFVQEKVGATSNLTIDDAQFEDEGEYVLQIQNSIITDLTLFSGRIIVGITSLLRDSAALVVLYQQTGGDNWVSANNWNAGSIDTWEGIVLNGAQDRVVEVNLPDNNLINTIPTKIRDITSLETADFSGNNLVSLPNMTFIPDLVNLDISNNQIGFAEIIINQPIPNFIYDPQNPIGSPILEKIPVGSPYLFDGNISGVGNQYQWNFGGDPISGATGKTFSLESIEYDSMGVYTLDVTNPLVPDFTLTSNDIEVLATADISGTVLNGAGPLTSGGDVSLWLVLDGPFDSVDVATIETTGAFLLQDIVLDDYIMKAVPTDDNIPVSYYGGSNTWTEADTIELRTQGETYDIQLVGEFSTGVEDDVLGLVEADLGEGDESGRIEARRKVKKAGCSLRRRTRSGGGRTGQDEFDLYLYTETNDEGNFVFKDIPDGTYVINIDYPGVPMDPNSFIEFEFGPSVGLETIELEALITSDGIVVEQTNALGFDAIEDFKVYPNPATEKITLSYQIGIRMDDLHLKAWTPDGKLIHQEALPYQMGIQQKELDVTAWDTGLYYLIIENSDKDVVVQWKLLIGD